MLEQALDTLPLEQRIAVELALVQGISYEESSRIERVSLGTFNSRLARPRGSCRKSFPST